MAKWNTVIENLKCGGCERTVTKLLLNIQGVKSAGADSNSGTVLMEYEGDESIIDKARAALKKAGYSPQGESNLRDKAVSYISCMKGKLSKDPNA